MCLEKIDGEKNPGNILWCWNIKVVQNLNWYGARSRMKFLVDWISLQVGDWEIVIQVGDC